MMHCSAAEKHWAKQYSFQMEENMSQPKDFNNCLEENKTVMQQL